MPSTRSCSTGASWNEPPFERVQQAQEAREGGDYEAITPKPELADAVVVGAGDFVAAVEHMLAD